LPFSAKELVPDVWPELLHHVEDGINGDLLAPFAHSLSSGSIFGGIVDIGNTSSNSVAENSDLVLVG